MQIRAYFEEWSRRPGEPVRMAISTPLAEVKAELVRLTTGPGAAGECRVGAEPVSGVAPVTVRGRLQNSPVGSYATLPLGGGAPKGSFSLHCSIWPTLPDKAEQRVWALQHESGEVRLTVANGQLSLVAEDVLVTADMRIEPRKWYSVVATVAPEGAVLDVRLLKGHTKRREARTAGSGRTIGKAQRLMLASTGPDSQRRAVNCYNGKIDSPRLYAGVLSAAQAVELHLTGTASATPVAEWLFGGDWSSRKVKSLLSGIPDGELVNGVERGVTGRNWDGRSDSFIETPDQYCALQFHADDMVDADWDYDLAFDLPAGIPSGVYAVKLTSGSETQHYPLFVMGPKTEQASALFLASTNTYLAYANDHLAALDFSQVMTHDMVVPEDEKLLFSDPQFGRSCYDTHSDGTPVRYSSRRRPIVNVRPGYPNWLTGSYRHFPQDMYFVEWMERTGLSFHVATDEDLHREGEALLRKYKVIVTSSHPEYWTRRGQDVLENYLNCNRPVPAALSGMMYRC